MGNPCNQKLPATIELVEYLRIGVPVSHLARYYRTTTNAIKMRLSRYKIRFECEHGRDTIHILRNQ